ncbi:U-scoloptoxin(20)-Cw1a [Leptopilina boulardi]|uniref:U-scoloptoxin(20)-Cw1a n=1 Tax=Leptopilina boulardi TaxID=63433 RepID=UPI0021F5ACB4|nr:U-scoloptoxin(20)-Cw1a [Leptopilina boulardi]
MTREMGRTIYIILLIAVCALWTFGEALSCDQCGRECMKICGTRGFRACCFNNLKKRVPAVGLWVDPPKQTGHFHLI